MQQTCITCKGNLFPYSLEDPDHCRCLPDDYEQCGECGYDHCYEWNAANAIHSALQQEDRRDTIPSPPSEITAIMKAPSFLPNEISSSPPTIPGFHSKLPNVG